MEQVTVLKASLVLRTGISKYKTDSLRVYQTLVLPSPTVLTSCLLPSQIAWYFPHHITCTLLFLSKAFLPMVPGFCGHSMLHVPHLRSGAGNCR